MFGTFHALPFSPAVGERVGLFSALFLIPNPYMLVAAASRRPWASRPKQDRVPHICLLLADVGVSGLSVLDSVLLNPRSSDFPMGSAVAESDMYPTDSREFARKNLIRKT